MHMNLTRNLVAAVTVSLMGLAQANATIIIAADNFDRADGSLTGTAPTPGPGGAWTDHSGTTGDLLLSGGEAVLQLGGGSEDTHTLFAGQTTGQLEASFDVTVNDDAPITGTDFEYFAHFMTEGSNNFRSRLDIVAATAAGDYTFGIASGSSTAEATFSTDFSYGVAVPVVLGFDLDTGIGSLTIGGTTISGTGILLGENLDSFALRQSGSSSGESISVDNLIVTIPEPSTLALLGFGGLMAFLRRHRR